ncbi:hypothetical protein HMF8227_01894 [Saliniradius amylolyticus]|uniref:Shikimate kinase n=1 Tax=Saliniradius amylolyticus TaxID=2183582 RepID=A0A2S2E400_9ALTE|nr:AAA family ATPase [Saliniradius amylolyticus]AWL12364.1 hypothetical protein HMF8227_01894 [Saliniradius amylolyticus]
MHNILIFGNSGSGKSTLASQLSDQLGLAHLDLDTIAWQPTTPPQRKPIAESRAEIDAFIQTHDQWVIEGCYSDLLALCSSHASEMIFLNLPVADCIANAKRRAWEPHKYESQEAQDANLPMLIDWIAQYTERQDTFSQTAHQQLYDCFQGKKTMLTSNQDPV